MQDNRKILRWVLLGTSAVGLSYLCYRFWVNWTKSQVSSRRKISEEDHEQPRMKTMQSNYSQFYFDKEEQLRNVLGQLNQTKGLQIEQLYLLSPLVLIDQYLKYTKQIRKRRRLIRKTNEEQYIGLIRNYLFEIKELLQRGREEVAQQCGQSIDDLQRIETTYQLFQNLQDLKKRAHQQLLAHAYPPSKLRRIPREKLRRIMEEQINFLSNGMHERIKAKLFSEEVDATPEETHTIILTLIDDIVYEKYGYEREEVEKQIEELPLLARELKKCRNNLFAEIGHFNMDSNESPAQSDDEDEFKNNMSNSAKTQILEDSKEEIE